MIITSTTDAGLAFLRSLAEPLRRLGDDYSVPLVAQQIGGNPVLRGTGCFFRCGQEWFLVTADHVIESLSPTGARKTGAVNDCDLLVPGVDDRLVSLSGRVSALPHHDVAIIWLADPSQIRERWTPITVADLAPQTDPAGAWYHITGWPTQLCTRVSGGLAAEKFRFTAKFDAGPEAYDPATEILLPLDRHDYGTFDGQLARYPELGGVSGAPVWQILTDGTGGRYEPRLAGIQHGYHDHGRVWYIRATRWVAIRALIEHVVPGLFKSAERLAGL